MSTWYKTNIEIIRIYYFKINMDSSPFVTGDLL